MSHDGPRAVYEAWQRLMQHSPDLPRKRRSKNDDLIEQAEQSKERLPLWQRAWELARVHPILIPVAIAVLAVFAPIAVLLRGRVKRKES